MKIELLFCFLFFCICKGEISLRVLFINVGNLDIINCWEVKLCHQKVVQNIRKYISKWKPDVILASEVFMKEQFTGDSFYGPILPFEYQGICGKSQDRNGRIVSWNQTDSSHEHECIGWKKNKLKMVSGSDLSEYGLNDEFGKKNCPFDFTGFRVVLEYQNQKINFVTVHPNSRVQRCRVNEIRGYWKNLVENPFTNKTIIGGDFNCGIFCYLGGICRDSTNEIQLNSKFRINYSNGRYWNLFNNYPNDPTAYAIGIYAWLDHAFSNFGGPCTNCGIYYNTDSLQYGAIVGGHLNHERADGGSGCDHRQILVDYKF